MRRRDFLGHAVGALYVAIHPASMLTTASTTASTPLISPYGSTSCTMTIPRQCDPLAEIVSAVGRQSSRITDNIGIVKWPK